MKQSGRGFHSYFVFILLLLMVVAVLSTLKSSEQNYSRQEFITDMDSGRVMEVEVNPNSETPTGYLKVMLNDGTLKRLYVTDIQEAEELVRNYGFKGRAQRELAAYHIGAHGHCAGSGCVSVYDDKCPECRRRQQQDDEFRQEPCEAVAG